MNNLPDHLLTTHILNRLAPTNRVRTRGVSRRLHNLPLDPHLRHLYRVRAPLNFFHAVLQFTGLEHISIKGNDIRTTRYTVNGNTWKVGGSTRLLRDRRHVMNDVSHAIRDVELQGPAHHTVSAELRGLSGADVVTLLSLAPLQARMIVSVKTCTSSNSKRWGAHVAPYMSQLTKPSWEVNFSKRAGERHYTPPLPATELQLMMDSVRQSGKDLCVNCHVSF